MDILLACLLLLITLRTLYVCVRARAKWVIPYKISTTIYMASLAYVKIAELVTIVVSNHANFAHSVVNFELAVRQNFHILGILS